jgi:hypothetical protein
VRKLLAQRAQVAGLSKQGFVNFRQTKTSNMQYGAFQLNEDQLLQLVAMYDTKNEAMAHIRSGSNMVLLEIHM